MYYESSSSSSSSSLARQPFVSPGLLQNHSPFFPIVGPSAYGVRLSASHPTPTWRTRVSLFFWLLPFDLSGLGGPTSSYDTAGIAFRVSGALKPYHHDKVGIASVGNVLKITIPNSYLNVCTDVLNFPFSSPR
jgi:hypothetical protein